MNMAIRTDASLHIGSGHVMRSLTLAEKLRSHGHQIAFFCRKLDGHLIEYIQSKGFEVNALRKPQNQGEVVSSDDWLEVDWQSDVKETALFMQKASPVELLIVDHYGIDYKWEEYIAPYVEKIMIIDDLSNRKHECDILLDQNIFQNGHERYQGLIPDRCSQLLGAEYALIREEFRTDILKPIEDVRTFFVYFGAVDKTNETQKVISVLKRIMGANDYQVKVVAGSSNPSFQEIKGMCATDSRFAFYTNVKEMADLMREADLAIGAGGSTTWERCCVGLASIVVPVAENQIAPMREIANLGAIHLMDHPSEKDYEHAIIQMLQKKSADLQKMREKGLNLYDGKGPDRVAEFIMKGENGSEFKGTL